MKDVDWFLCSYSTKQKKHIPLTIFLLFNAFPMIKLQPQLFKWIVYAIPSIVNIDPTFYDHMKPLGNGPMETPHLHNPNRAI